MCLAAASAILQAQEFPIADPILRPATGLQTSPAVASSGTDFLSVWTDNRSVDPSGFSQPDIYASRIWPGGNLDRAGGVAVTPTAWIDDSPNVIWNGDEYVVVNRVANNGAPLGAMFSRVTDTGPQPGTFVSVPVAGRLVAAWNGSVYLVVFGPNQSKCVDNPGCVPGSIRAFVVDRSFRLLGEPFAISEANVDSFLPSVSSDGNSFFVTWMTGLSPTQGEVRSAVVSNSGDVVRSPSPVASITAWYAFWTPPSIAWNGAEYLVTWSDGRSVFGRLLDRTITPEGDVFTIAGPDLDGMGTVAAGSNGNLFAVSFSRRDRPAPTAYPVAHLYLTRIRSDGTVVDAANPIRVSAQPGEQTASAIAAAGSRFAIVWQNATDIRETVFDSEAAVMVADELVSRSIGRESDARGVYDGQNFGFLWNEEGDVLFGRMSLEGTSLDGPGLKLGTGLVRGLLTNGNVELALWSDTTVPNGAPKATRISSAGDILDPVPIALPVSSQAQATDGTDFLIVGTQSRVAPDGWAIPHLVTFVITGGGVVTAPQELVAAEFDQYVWAVVWDGTNYVVLYRQYLAENCYHCYADYEDQGVVVDRSGRAVGAPFRLQYPAWTAGGRGLVFLAQRVWIPGNHYQLTYTIVDESGRTVAPPAVLGVDTPFITDVAWDGRTFLILVGPTMYRIDPQGRLVDQRNVVPPGASEVHLVPARGSDPLLILRIVKQQPYRHNGGIERYFLDWPHPSRSRAVEKR